MRARAKLFSRATGDPFYCLRPLAINISAGDAGSARRR